MSECLLGKYYDSFLTVIRLPLTLFYWLDLMLCLDKLLFRGLETECDYILFRFMLLFAVTLLPFFYGTGGLESGTVA